MFLILPLAAEVLFVAAIMLARLDGVFAVILVGHGGALRRRRWSSARNGCGRHQRKAVAEGAIAHGKAVDSLLNYETVKYFGNESHIAERYDASLAEVERLTVRAAGASAA